MKVTSVKRSRATAPMKVIDSFVDRGLVEGGHASLPDIDVDYASDRRQEMKEYLEERYNVGGRQRVFSAGTFTTLKLKAALKDAARVHRVPHGTVNYITLMLDDGADWTGLFKIAATNRKERDRYKQNNTALLSDIERIKVDSTTMDVDAKALRLTIDEYERFRAEDAEKIRQMGVKIKNLQAAAKHQMEVAAPINAVIRDTVFIRDTVQVVQQKVEMASLHIQLEGVIDNDSLKGNIRLPVTLQQTVWVEYKRKCIFWKKVKAIHQTISSDNPYVDIKYSEYIQIDKR